jgi:hypothetical protein
MNINLDLLLCLYGLGAAISFIIYIILLHKNNNNDNVSINTFELIFILLIISAIWWLGVSCHIVMILYKWLCKPVINKRKLE